MDARRWVMAIAAALVVLGGAAGSASAAVPTAVFSVPGVTSPGTPAKYDKVQVRRFGSPSARKVLVLIPGTLAGAGDFSIIAPYLVEHVPHLQVWAEMRREGALEDNTELLKGFSGQQTPQQVFDFYEGWIANSMIEPHYQPLANANFAFVHDWGLAVAMGDLHNVIEKARDGGRRTVVLGGHSLGGSEVADYASWDFAGHAGYKDIAGMIGIDGGPSANPSLALQTAAQASQELSTFSGQSPFLDLFGFGLPWISGPLSEVGALTVLKAPDQPSIAQAFPLLPAELKPPEPVTNEAQYGYAFDVKTSPPSLKLIQVHSGHLDTSTSPATWVNDGITPIQNVAQVFSIEPLGGVDWYYPTRLTIDVGAAANLVPTPADATLGVRVEHAAQVNVPYYAFQTALGGTNNALDLGVHAFVKMSKIPSLTFVNRKTTYSHLDPLLATPSKNDFLKTVTPWLRKIPLSH